MKPDGCLLGRSIGPNSFKELRDSFYLAESERLGGYSEKFPKFISAQALGNLINRLDLQMTSVFNDNSVQNVKSVDEIMLQIKDSGYSGILNSNSKLDAQSLREVYIAAFAFY